MQQKLKNAKEKIVRHAPKVGALAGTAVLSAVLMNRYDAINMSAGLVTVNRAVLAQMKETSKGIVFETPTYGTFVLAPTPSSL